MTFRFYRFELKCDPVAAVPANIPSLNAASEAVSARFRVLVPFKFRVAAQKGLPLKLRKRWSLASRFFAALYVGAAASFRASVFYVLVI